jgi:predicted DsbA family dithiol-disulfide isomerase
MELTVLAVPGCPNVALLARRLTIAAVGLLGMTVIQRVVDDEAQAAALGMRGSPTLLIDGADPFASGSQPTGLACRLYPQADGSLRGAPPVRSLRRALEQGVRARIDKASDSDPPGSGR